MWVYPENLAESVFNSLTDIEKERVKANIDNYGAAFIKKFYYDEMQAGLFIDKLKELLGVS